MPIYAWMLTGLMMGAPPATPVDDAPAVRLQKGLEINWRGTFSEAILRPNVRAFRIYDVETWAFAVDVTDAGADVAVFTTITLRPDLKATPKPMPIVRLELCRVDSTGKLSLLPLDSLSLPSNQRKPAALPLMAMEGLPTFETSLFISLPAEKLRLGQTWSVPEEQRPPLIYRIEGVDSVRGSRCFKVGAVQQTDDWENPHPQADPWRRGETILVSAKHGYTARLERTIEKRDSQSSELAFRSRLVCELHGSLPYPNRLGQERRDEIAAAAQFTAEFEKLLPDAGRIGEQPFELLLKRIDQHISSHAASEAVPYRQALMVVRRKVEAAKRGDIPPAPPPPETHEKSVVGMGTPVPDLPLPLPLEISQKPPETNTKLFVATGAPAPDLIVTDLTNRKPVSLSALRGLPVVLLWYQPSSDRTAEPVLHFAQTLFDQLGNKAYILPLAIGDGAAALKQHNDLKLTVHVLSAHDEVKKHGITSAPYFEVLNKDGVVRFMAVGWSDDNAQAVRAELEKLLK